MYKIQKENEKIQKPESLKTSIYHLYSSNVPLYLFFFFSAINTFKYRYMCLLHIFAQEYKLYFDRFIHVCIDLKQKIMTCAMSIRCTIIMQSNTHTEDSMDIYIFFFFHSL